MKTENITLIGCISFQIVLSIFAFYILTINNAYLSFPYKEMTLVYSMVGVGAISIYIYICIYGVIMYNKEKNHEDIGKDCKKDTK